MDLIRLPQCLILLIIETLHWNQENYEIKVSAFQRPFIRDGLGLVQIGDILYMWGGKVLYKYMNFDTNYNDNNYNFLKKSAFISKIISGTDKKEFYSAMMLFETQNKDLISDDIGGLIPVLQLFILHKLLIKFI